MGLRSFSPILLGFVAAVLLTQNLVVGYCSSQQTLFLANCPANQAGCCGGCGCETGHNDLGGDCCRFLNLELDDFLEVPPFPVANEVPSLSLPTERFPRGADRIRPDRVIRSLPIRAGPPPGIPLFLRFSVALI